jgi:hypothetical protein
MSTDIRSIQGPLPTGYNPACLAFFHPPVARRTTGSLSPKRTVQGTGTDDWNSSEPSFFVMIFVLMSGGGVSPGGSARLHPDKNQITGSNKKTHPSQRMSLSFH